MGSMAAPDALASTAAKPASTGDRPHRWPRRPRSVRRPAPGWNPHRAPGSGHVRGPRQHRADSRRADRRAGRAVQRGADADPGRSLLGRPDRRSAARLGDSRRGQPPRLVDRHDRLRRLAVRRTLRVERHASPLPDSDAGVRERRARSRPHRRRRARADLRRPARHGRPHVPRADARGVRRAGHPLDDRRLPERTARPEPEEQPPQPVRVPRRNRRTRTSRMPS